MERRDSVPSAVRGFPASPESVAEARHWLTGVLAGWSVERSMIGDAELVLSELVTNAVRYGAGDIVCELEQVDESRCRVSVADAGVHRPYLRAPGLADLGGRGLRIVDRLAGSWGVTDSTEGKTVWAIVPS